jgi:hypothetical protein
MSERQQLRLALAMSKEEEAAKLAVASSAPALASHPGKRIASTKLVARKAAPKVPALKKAKLAARRRRKDDDGENVWGSSSDQEEEDRRLPPPPPSEEEGEGEEEEEEEEERPARRGRARGRATKPRKAPVRAKPAPKPKPAASSTNLKAKKVKELFGSSESGSEEEEEEEEDAPSSAPAKPAAAAMEDMDDPGYDSDLIIDAEDQARLQEMTEIDREQILSERYERRQRFKEVRALRGSAANREQAPAASRPTRAGARQVPSKRVRPQVVDSTSEESEAPVRGCRRHQGLADACQAAPSEDESSASEEEEEDEEEEDVSDSEAFAGGSRARGSKDAAGWLERIFSDEEEEDDNEEEHVPDASPVDLELLRGLCLPRRRLLELVDHPNFEAGIRGHLVRVPSEQSQAPQQQYDCMVIVGVVATEDSYGVDAERVRSKLEVRDLRGKSSDLSLDRVSSRLPGEADIARWWLEPSFGKFTKDFAARAARRFKALVQDHVFTPEQIEQVLKRREARLKKPVVANPSAKRTMINEELNELLRSKDAVALRLGAAEHDSQVDELAGELGLINAAIADLQRQLRDVERQIMGANERLKASSLTQIVNERNYVKNNAAHAVAQDRRLAEKRSAKDTETINPFMRRPTRPTMLWATHVEGDTSAHVEASPAAAPLVARAPPAPAAAAPPPPPPPRQPVAPQPPPRAPAAAEPAAVEAKPAAKPANNAMSFVQYKERLRLVQAQHGQ